jgi:acyl-coenzyme A synthetase/AMP-(fatty) acid ligase
MVKTKFDNMEFTSAGVDDHMYLFVTKEELADKVKQFVVSKTGLHPKAFQTVVIDEIPQNDAGKTLYKELAKYYDI